MKNTLVFACALSVAACAAAADGISFEGLSPIDAAAFSIERADKDGDRIYQFTEKSGTHAREIVVVPDNGLKAEAAEVRYPNGGTAERPFVENGKIYRSRRAKNCRWCGRGRDGARPSRCVLPKSSDANSRRASCDVK